MRIEALAVVFWFLFFLFESWYKYQIWCLICYYLYSRVNDETSSIEHYLTSWIQQVQKKKKQTNKQNYYIEILGVNIHDEYVNSAALWTFSVTA